MIRIHTIRPEAKIRQDIRRHRGHSVDFDFYRTRATALRGQAKRDTSTLKSALAGILAFVGALAIVVLVAAATVHAPDSQVAARQTDAAPIR